MAQKVGDLFEQQLSVLCKLRCSQRSAPLFTERAQTDKAARESRHHFYEVWSDGIVGSSLGSVHPLIDGNLFPWP